MACSLYNIVYLNRFCDTDRVGFKDIANLIVRQSASLNMIRIVRQIDLNLMIDTTMELRRFLCSEKSSRRGVANPPPLTTPYVPSSAYGVSVGLDLDSIPRYRLNSFDLYSRLPAYPLSIISSSMSNCFLTAVSTFVNQPHPTVHPFPSR